MGCKEGEEEEVGRGGGEEGRGGVVEEMAKNATIFAYAALRCAAICANRTAAKLLLASFIRGQDGEGDKDSHLGDDDVEDIGDNDVEEGEEEDNERDVEVEGGANLTAAKLPAAFLI